MRDRLHSMKNTSQRLGISRWSLRRAIDRGEIRGVRIGRRVLVSEKEIARVIDNGTREAQF
jgi:excisionase family DNA binding protein